MVRTWAAIAELFLPTEPSSKTSWCHFCHGYQGCWNRLNRIRKVDAGRTTAFVSIKHTPIRAHVSHLQHFPIQSYGFFLVASIVANDDSAPDDKYSVCIDKVAYIRYSPPVSPASSTSTTHDSGSLRRIAGASRYRGDFPRDEKERTWFPWCHDS